MVKRSNFANIQASHVTPCPNYEQSRVRTGYEVIVAHRASDKYAVAAKEDGMITDINEKLKMFTVKYRSGKSEAISYASYEGDVGGIYIKQDLTLNIKLGERVKTGDILVYNPGFFSPAYNSKQVNWNHGINARVALITNDHTIEDSSTIVPSFAEKLTISPTELRSVTVTCNTIIKSIVKVGDKVGVEDTLCTLEDASIADLVAGLNTDDIDLIAELNMKHPKAKHHGVISKIDVFYSCPIESMTSSLAGLVTSIRQEKVKRHNYAKQSGQGHDYPIPSEVPAGTKFKGVEFTDDTILIMFYINATYEMDGGSKLVIGNQLKSVVDGVLSYIPTTEDGKPIDVLFGPGQVAARIVMSPIINGRIAASLIDAEEQIVDMYFN